VNQVAIHIRTATDEDIPAVRNVIDGAALQVPATLAEQINHDDVLVAVDGGTGETNERILGALVLDEEEILAVAVRLRRRNQCIGTALVEEAATRRGRLIAEFDETVRPFWSSLEFEIVERYGSGRFRATRTA